MTNSGIWIPMIAPVRPRKSFIVRNFRRPVSTFCLAILRLSSVVLRYHILPSLTSSLTIYLFSSVMLHPRGLVTCLQAHWCNLTEWAQSIYHAMWIGKSRSWSLASTASFGYPKVSPLLSRYIRHAVWCDQPHLPEAGIWYDLTVKGMNTTFLYFGYVHQIIHPMIWLRCYPVNAHDQETLIICYTTN